MWECGKYIVMTVFGATCMGIKVTMVILYGNIDYNIEYI